MQVFCFSLCFLLCSHVFLVISWTFDRIMISLDCFVLWIPNIIGFLDSHPLFYLPLIPLDCRGILHLSLCTYCILEGIYLSGKKMIYILLVFLSLQWFISLLVSLLHGADMLWLLLCTLLLWKFVLCVTLALFFFSLRCNDLLRIFCCVFF